VVWPSTCSSVPSSHSQPATINMLTRKFQVLAADLIQFARPTDCEMCSNCCLLVKDSDFWLVVVLLFDAGACGLGSGHSRAVINAASKPANPTSAAPPQRAVPNTPSMPAVHLPLLSGMSRQTKHQPSSTVWACGKLPKLVRCKGPSEAEKGGSSHARFITLLPASRVFCARNTWGGKTPGCDVPQWWSHNLAEVHTELSSTCGGQCHLHTQCPPNSAILCLADSRQTGSAHTRMSPCRRTPPLGSTVPILHCGEKPHLSLCLGTLLHPCFTKMLTWWVWPW